MDKTIGELIRENRARLKMTQLELATLLGVARPTVGMWETNKVLPTRSIKKLEEVFDMPPGSLYLMVNYITDPKDS